MQLAPPRYLEINHGDVVISIPMPVLAQIEDCIRLDLPAEGVVENAITRHQRIIDQLLVLTVSLDAGAADKTARRDWLGTLQYHQLLDLHRRMMLWVQGIDFETQEQFEAAWEAQKKSTVTTPLNPELTPSPASASSPSGSP